MKIDAHNHPDWLGHDLNKHLANMAKFGIDKTWLLTWECPQNEYYQAKGCPGYPLFGQGPMPLSRMVSFIERAPDKFIPGYCPDPRRPDALDALEAAIDLYDVRICGELKVRATFDDPDHLALFRLAGAKGLPVTIHLDYAFIRPDAPRHPRPNYWYGGSIGALERALQACPETTFLGHAPGFWAHISGDDLFDKEPYPKEPILPDGKVAQLLRTYPNLFCDMSASSGRMAFKRDFSFSKDFFIEFQDRILYARDCFDNGHAELIESLNLPQSVKDKVYSGNALKLVPPDKD